MRYPTQACEGVCTLNHYCAITRIDYREFRQCLETAASALASSTKPLIVDRNFNRIFLLTLPMIQLLLYQRKLLFESIILTAYLIYHFCFKYLNILWNFIDTISFLLLQNLNKLFIFVLNRVNYVRTNVKAF